MILDFSSNICYTEYMKAAHGDDALGCRNGFLPFFEFFVKKAGHLGIYPIYIGEGLSFESNV
ncbi:MAG: hypothetical protein IJX72_02770 [Clostridia bacterium]|nr:hypothetical protein [Clostridia bacterium]